MTRHDPGAGETGRHRQHHDHPPSGHVRGDHPAGASTDPCMGFGTSPEDRLHLPETPLDSGKRTGSTVWPPVRISSRCAWNWSMRMLVAGHSDSPKRWDMNITAQSAAAAGATARPAAHNRVTDRAAPRRKDVLLMAGD